MEADPMVTLPFVEAYVYEQRPMTPRTLKLLGMYAAEVLAEMRAPYGEGPMTRVEFDRAQKLQAFSDQLIGRRWRTAQDFFENNSVVVYEEAPLD